jgi:hypothetical protein
MLKHVRKMGNVSQKQIMVEHQQREEGHHILTEGFEAQSPLAVRINRYIIENIKPSDFVDIKYSSFSKADDNETSYSAKSSKE